MFRYSLPSEKYFTIYNWYFSSVMLFYIVTNYGLINFNINNLFRDFIFITVFGVVNYIRNRLIDFGVAEIDYFQLRSRLVEIFFICFAFFYLDFSVWIASFVIGQVVLVTMLRGRRIGLYAILLSFAATIFFGILSSGTNNTPIEYFSFLIILLVSFAVWYVISIISKQTECFYNDKETDFEKLNIEKQELVFTLKDLEDKNEKYRENLKKVEDLNEELKVSLDKYYEFHHISSVIGSIYDTNGLLKFINETILEIIDAHYSTIFLFEPKRGSLVVNVTNISNEDNLQKLIKNINNDIIYDIIENGTPYVVNFVESSDYEFVRGRQVKSFVCMPISTTKKKYGVVLAESTEFNKFNSESQKLITLIGHQLSTSIENLELYKRMKELATIDGLTNIYNRLYFRERLSRELKIAHENDYPLSLVIFDVDHFKRVNDTYSHMMGDKVLKSIATVIKNSIRRSDVISRYGGEEFVILFPNMDIIRAQEVCDNLRKKIESTKVTGREIVISITASFGVSNYPSNALSEENLVRAADRALYEAKDSGRNCVKISQEKLM